MIMNFGDLTSTSSTSTQQSRMKEYSFPPPQHSAGVNNDGTQHIQQIQQQPPNKSTAESKASTTMGMPLVSVVNTARTIAITSKYLTKNWDYIRKKDEELLRSGASGGGSDHPKKLSNSNCYGDGGGGINDLKQKFVPVSFKGLGFMDRKVGRKGGSSSSSNSSSSISNSGGTKGKNKRRRGNTENHTKVRKDSISSTIEKRRTLRLVVLLRGRSKTDSKSV